MDTLNDSVLERFWAKVKKGAGLDDCWMWTACTVQGYGRIKIGGRDGQQLDAHRMSYELANGPIPPGLFVMHSCDVRKCVNPNHLSLGTARDNNKDRDRKGKLTIKRGSKNGNSKLIEDQVLEIRRLGKEKIISQREIAAMNGVTLRNVEMILAGTTWAHLIPA